jgi:hypothetical protein
MGTQDISGVKSSGNTIDETWYNDFRSLLLGAVLGRDPSSGAVAAAQDLGSAIVPWGNLYAGGLVIGGSAIDFSDLTGVANSILSGRIRTTSSFPDFIRANGAAASFQILGATTNLSLNIANTATTVSTDLTETGLTAAPGTNNTALVDDTGLTGQTSSKYQGEDGTTLTIDTAGTEITSRIGQYVTFKTGTEYFLAFVKSATELTNCYRGYYFDSSGLPVERVALNNNDTLTIMSTAWVFVENDATTVDVTYVTPIYSFTEPTTPATDDYWFDRGNEVWKRYSGSAFVTINRILVGLAIIDSTNCVVSRSLNFTKSFEAFNAIRAEYESATEIQAKDTEFTLSVYGEIVNNAFTPYIWDITTDLELSQTEAANTDYYAYVTQAGEQVLSNIKPYNQSAELKGWYHPYNSWRAIGVINNNGSSNFDTTTLLNYSGYDSVIGLDIQAFGTALDVIKDLTPAADKLAYYTGADSSALATLTSFARTLLDDADAATARATLGVASVPHLDVFTSSGTWTKPSGVTEVRVTVVGGGAGGGGSGGTAATNGGTSSFGAFCSATGGTAVTSPVGGVGSGGDINIKGGSGGGAGAGNHGGSGAGLSGGGGGANSAATVSNGGNYGGGGGGGTTSVNGGGGGGCAIEVVTVTGNVTVTVGAGGSAATGSTGAGSGAAGVVMVEYNDAT